MVDRNEAVLAALGPTRALAASPTPMAVLDDAGRLVWVNQAFEQLLGWDAIELVARPLRGRVRRQDAARYDELCSPQRRDGSAELALVHRAGHLTWVVLNASGVRNDDGARVGTLCTAHDVTDRRDAESALVAAEGQFRDAFDSAPIGMALVAPNGIILKVNRALTAILRQTDSQLLARDFTELIDPSELEVDRSAARQLRSGGVRSYRDEVRLLAGDGELVWTMLSASLVRDAIGAPVHYVFQVEDITERKLADQRLAEVLSELERSNRDLENFAHIAAHDLKSPIQTVQGFVRTVLSRADDRLDDLERQLLNRALGGTLRMDELIDDVLAYASRQQQDDPLAPVVLDDVLVVVLDGLAGTIEAARATVDVEPLPTVLGDAGQLRQLFHNLLSNALKFTRPGVAPIVRIGAEQRGSTWVLRVDDNGIGIPEDQRAGVFEVFQRLHTRGEYEGTGLGLAICARVVERHGGTITIGEASGGGASFRFPLPAAPAQRPAAVTGS